MSMLENKKSVGENSMKHKCALCPYSTKRGDHYKEHLATHSNEKPFKCPECPYRAKVKQGVNSHFKNIHLPQFQSRKFPCQHSGCSYASKQKSKLIQHSKVHSLEKSWVCSHPNCSYSTKHNKSLSEHTRRIHGDEKPWVCQLVGCLYSAVTSSELVQHSRTHTKERPYKCLEPNCEYSAAQLSTLKIHRLTHEPNPETEEGEEERRPSFSCPLCSFSTKHKTSLSTHIKGHTLEKLFKCDEPNCNYEAKTNCEIKTHKVTHSDEKPFKCSFEFCEYRCKKKVYLANHMKTHSAERRYKCELCPFRGKQSSVVSNHIKTVHSDPNFRPFKCKEPKCDYAGKAKSDLAKHLLIHKAEKNYRCSFPLCDYRSIEKGNLTQHQYRIHSEEKRENCSICDKKFKSKTELSIHFRTHTKEKPFGCPEKLNGCEYRATCSSNLKAHVKKHGSQIVTKTK